MNRELSDVQNWVCKRQMNQRSNCQHLLDHEKGREFQKKSISASLTSLKPLTVWITTNWKILKEIGIPDHLTCLLRNLYAEQEATELDMKQLICSKLEKEYIKDVYCHPAYLTYMQSTPCEMLGWMTHKLESRLPGEISTTSDKQMIPL